MAKAIFWAALLLLSVAAYTWLVYRMGVMAARIRIIREGGAGQQGVDLIKQAHEVFTEQTHPSMLIEAGGYDMLSERTSKKVQEWFGAYNNWRGKAR